MSRIHRSVLITGASSGIGRALALAYAEPGVRLALVGRDAARLEATAAGCRERGALVEAGTLDVRDRAAMAAWISAADAALPFDLAIANAGITTGLGPGDLTEDPDSVRAIIATNLLGVLNTAEPLIGPMCARRSGQLAFVGSIAGLRGLPYSPAYCVTKAGVHAYAEAIRARLEARGVLVSLVVAGFVKTPLNDFDRGDQAGRDLGRQGRRADQARPGERHGDHRLSAVSLRGGDARPLSSGPVVRPPDGRRPRHCSGNPRTRLKNRRPLAPLSRHPWRDGQNPPAFGALSSCSCRHPGTPST